MKASEDHTTRTEYAGAATALLDAHQVLLDLLAISKGELLIPVTEFEFLARRADQLVLACLDRETRSEAS